MRPRVGVGAIDVVEGIEHPDHPRGLSVNGEYITATPIHECVAHGKKHLSSLGKGIAHIVTQILARCKRERRRLSLPLYPFDEGEKECG